MGTGDPLLLEHRSGGYPFAGQFLELEDFTGVFGYASDAAYVVTFSGSAQIEKKRAKPGHMLLIPPSNGEVEVVTFDAKRLGRKKMT